MGTVDLAAERLKFRGRLEEAKEAMNKARMRVETRRDGLRAATDPFAAFADLDGEVIVSLAVEMADALIEFAEHEARIAAIKKALGE